LPSSQGEALSSSSGLGGRCARPESFAEPSKIIKRTSSTISFLDDTEHQRFKQVTPEGSTLYIAAFGALTASAA